MPTTPDTHEAHDYVERIRDAAAAPEHVCSVTEMRFVSGHYQSHRSWRNHPLRACAGTIGLGRREDDLGLLWRDRG